MKHPSKAPNTSKAIIRVRLVLTFVIVYLTFSLSKFLFDGWLASEDLSAFLGAREHWFSAGAIMALCIGFWFYRRRWGGGKDSAGQGRIDA